VATGHWGGCFGGARKYWGPDVILLALPLLVLAGVGLGIVLFDLAREHFARRKKQP
jgi:hypothetical protein